MKYVNGTVEQKRTVTTFLNKYPNKQAFCKRFKNTYNEYKNDILEKDARKAKKEIKEDIDYARKRGELNGTRIERRSTLRGTPIASNVWIRGRREQGGQFSIETEPTRQEINKTTTLSNSDSAVQRVAKNEVRKWFGGIEKDRYDVNKNLSAFVRHTDRVAKDLSKKLGFKVNGKMVREIMPFLRERTDFPMKLDRKDLKRLFTSLSSQDKAILRSDADVISNKLQKYYENYNYAHGIVPDEQIENHISHIWDLDNKKSALLTSYFSTKSKFAKQRTNHLFK